MDHPIPVWGHMAGWLVSGHLKKRISLGNLIFGGEQTPRELCIPPGLQAGCLRGDGVMVPLEQ